MQHSVEKTVTRWNYHITINIYMNTDKIVQDQAIAKKKYLGSHVFK